MVRRRGILFSQLAKYSLKQQKLFRKRMDGMSGTTPSSYPGKLLVQSPQCSGDCVWLLGNETHQLHARQTL